MTEILHKDTLDKGNLVRSEYSSLQLAESSNTLFGRPEASGKFLFLGDEKFFVKGATYGAFAPNSEGHQFPEPPVVESDFALMRDAGINTILTYTVPPVSFLDQA